MSRRDRPAGSKPRGRNAAAALVLLALVACSPPPVADLTSRPLPTPVTAVAATPVPVTRAPETLVAPSATVAASTRTPPPTSTPQVGKRSAGDSYAPGLGNTGYDVQHYDLALEIDPSHTYLSGRAAITATSTLSNMVEFSLDFAGFEIETLALDGEAVDFMREGDKLVILPGEALANGQVFLLEIDYAGVPEQRGSEYIPFFHHLGLQFLGEATFAYSQPDGARFWFPANDHPLDKATFSFTLSVPDGLVAVANGTQTSFEEEGNRDVYTWEHPFPMATYLATVAVSEYTLLEGSSPQGIPLRHFVQPGILAAFEVAAAPTGEALDWMADTFGPYPFESFGFVTTPIIRASLETQGMVLLSDQMLNEETIIHEIAHMWFGDWVSMASWADMWHNEGFAVYISMMWSTRERPESLDVLMANLEARVGREASADPLGNLSHDLLFGFDSYQRGALMLHSLRRTVGDEAYFHALNQYLVRFGGGTATREDFIGIFEEVSGMELGDFFAEWLE